MSDTTYRVKAAACYVTVPGVGSVLLYKDAPVPDSAENLAELEAEGFVEQVDVEEVGGLQNDVPEDYEPPVGVPAGAPDDVDGDGPIPPRSAAKADWVAYAVSQGATQEEADAATKDDLIAKYGSV